MKRTCEQCGRMFEATRARYCASQCRMRTSPAGKAASGVVNLQSAPGSSSESLAAQVFGFPAGQVAERLRKKASTADDHRPPDPIPGVENIGRPQPSETEVRLAERECPDCNPPGSGNAAGTPDDIPPEDCYTCGGSGRVPASAADAKPAGGSKVETVRLGVTAEQVQRQLDSIARVQRRERSVKDAQPHDIATATARARRPRQDEAPQARRRVSKKNVDAIWCPLCRLWLLSSAWRQEQRLGSDQIYVQCPRCEAVLPLANIASRQSTVTSTARLLPGLTMTRPMDGRVGRGLIPRHAEKIRLACGAPEGTRISQVYDEDRDRWSLAIALPGRPWMLIPGWPDSRMASGLEPSAWGGLYDLRSLAQIGMRLEATERGGYC